MTLEETKRRLLSLIDYRRAINDDCGILADDIAALETACEIIDAAIKNQNTGRVYTTFDVIQLVQRVVSNETCRTSADDTELCIAYEIERDCSRVGEGGSKWIEHLS